MADVEEAVQKQVAEILKVNNKFIQAFNLRTTLITKRLPIINKIIKQNMEGVSEPEPLLLKPLLTDKELKILIFCNRNEIRLMEILEAAKEPTLALLKTVKLSSSEAKVLDNAIMEETKGEIGLETLQEAFKVYVSIVNLFYDNYGNIIMRLEKESEFIKNPTLATIKKSDYLKLIKREIELQQTSEAKIKNLVNGNPHLISDKEELSTILMAGANIGIMANKNSLISFLKYLGYKNNPQAIYLLACVAVALFAAGLALRVFYAKDRENRIFEQTRYLAEKLKFT